MYEGENYRMKNEIRPHSSVLARSLIIGIALVGLLCTVFLLSPATAYGTTPVSTPNPYSQTALLASSAVGTNVTENAIAEVMNKTFYAPSTVTLFGTSRLTNSHQTLNNW